MSMRREVRDLRIEALDDRHAPAAGPIPAPFSLCQFFLDLGIAPLTAEIPETIHLAPGPGAEPVGPGFTAAPHPADPLVNAPLGPVSGNDSEVP